MGVTAALQAGVAVRQAAPGGGYRIAAGSNGAVLVRRVGACWQNDSRFEGAIRAYLWMRDGVAYARDGDVQP